jgi:ubiquinone/menaquinone biosynthesis C-methylase UbiE
MNNWWNSFFDESFAELMLDGINEKKRRVEASFLIKELNLEKGDIVFDQCCGIKTIGVDQSEDYIRLAKEKAKSRDSDSQFLLGDAFEFTCSNLCDAAFNWYTSFGYSENYQMNIKIFRNAYDSLKKTGRYILDYFNLEQILKNFKEKELFTREISAGCVSTVMRESSIDLIRGMLISKWTYNLADGTKTIKTGESRMYSMNNLKEMLESCGFKIMGVKGDATGSLYTKHSPRCIVIAEK